MNCPHCKIGSLEASATVYLDIDRGTILDDGTVQIDEMSFSHLNDEYKATPISLEAGFVVSCGNCGHEYAEKLSDEALAQTGLQPIGGAERTLGKRGGLKTDNSDQSPQ